jgi:GT2 family glycosyltransferase
MSRDAGDPTVRAADVSVVIPTYNRPGDLRECLRSILSQTARPGEVLGVDNGDPGATRELVASMSGDFAAAGIALQHVPNLLENSLTTAKNIGIDRSRGALISFLDDDVVLDPGYYEAILEAYRRSPGVLGVEGAVVGEGSRNPIAAGLDQALGRVFFLGFREPARCRVLPSLAVTYPRGGQPVSCEWLSGAATYRRLVFNEFRPDEKLRKYADNEDLDLSYRIYRRFPGSLMYLPEAKYRHKGSVQGRVTGMERVYMQEVYRLYLFYKHMDATVVNTVIYLWSRLGRMVYLVGRSAVRRSRIDLWEAGHLLGAWRLCLRHRCEIRAGDLAFFNRLLD